LFLKLIGGIKSGSIENMWCLRGVLEGVDNLNSGSFYPLLGGSSFGSKPSKVRFKTL
jgi:hypothetical protein